MHLVCRDLICFLLSSLLPDASKNIGDLAHRKDTGQFLPICYKAANFLQGKNIPSLLQTLTSVDLWVITHWIVRFIPMYMHLQAIMPRPHLPIRNILVSMLISKRNSIPNFYMRKSICILPSFIRTQRFVWRRSSGKSLCECCVTHTGTPIRIFPWVNFSWAVHHSGWNLEPIYWMIQADKRKSYPVSSRKFSLDVLFITDGCQRLLSFYKRSVESAPPRLDSSMDKEIFHGFFSRALWSGWKNLSSTSGPIRASAALWFPAKRNRTLSIRVR